MTPNLCHFQLFFRNSLIFNFQALDQHLILFWPQNSFLLMSENLIGSFKIFSNDQVRWLASAKYVRNEPSVGSKLRSLETSFAKTNQMTHRDDSNRWSDGLFLWTDDSDDSPNFSHWNRKDRSKLNFSKTVLALGVHVRVCGHLVQDILYHPGIYGQERTVPGQSGSFRSGPSTRPGHKKWEI